MDIGSRNWLSDMRSQHGADYRVEVELSDRLRNAPTTERGKIDGQVYAELYQRLPDHPQLTMDQSERDRAVAHRLRWIRRFCNRRCTFLQIGAGNGDLVLAMAAIVKRALGIDFSESLDPATNAPSNVEMLGVDGVTLPLPSGSVDVAYSDQFIQRLHPDDAAAHLLEVRHVLSPFGKYVCITANRASGPHDISVFFDDVARGVHLREYSASELSQVLHSAGFARVRFYLGGGGYYVQVPSALMSTVERMFLLIPDTTRRRLTESAVTAHTYPLLGLNVVADGIRE